MFDFASCKNGPPLRLEARSVLAAAGTGFTDTSPGSRIKGLRNGVKTALHLAAVLAPWPFKQKIGPDSSEKSAFSATPAPPFWVVGLRSNKLEWWPERELHAAGNRLELSRRGAELGRKNWCPFFFSVCVCFCTQ